MKRDLFVTGVDFSPASQHALVQGLKLARKCDAELHLFHVHSDSKKSAGEIEESIQKMLADAGHHAEGVHTTYEILADGKGDLAEQIGTYVDSKSPDLFVAGYEVKKGLKRILDISISKIISETRTPVWCIREDHALNEANSIVFPIILGEYSLQKLKSVTRIASLLKLHIHILPIWVEGMDTESAHAKLKVFARQVEERFTEAELSFEVRFMEGRDPYQLINDYVTLKEVSLSSKVFDADEAPYVKLLGTKDEEILEYAKAPILYVRSVPEQQDIYKSAK